MFEGVSHKGTVCNDSLPSYFPLRHRLCPMQSPLRVLGTGESSDEEEEEEEEEQQQQQ